MVDTFLSGTDGRTAGMPSAGGGVCFYAGVAREEEEHAGISFYVGSVGWFG